jgi:hypothetical protein
VTPDELKAMRALEREAKRLGKEIDHVVPLEGKFVAGLQVLLKMQILTHDEHRRKTKSQRRNPYTHEEAVDLVRRGLAVWRFDIGADGSIAAT